MAVELDPEQLVGDPAAIQANAQAWRELSERMHEHSDRIVELIGHTTDGWSSAASNAFQDNSLLLARSVSDAGEVSALVADHLDGHASHQKLLGEILEELAIQIAATLAMWAVAAYVPPLVAALEARLALLTAQLGRAMSLVDEVSRTLMEFLIRVRTWIVQLSKLTWRTERFSIGYGKILYEGVRDGAQDLVSNLTATRIQHKEVDPALLFISAGSSLVGGGLAGLVEASGAKKLVIDGELQTAGGLPKYVSNVDRFRALLRGLGKSADDEVAAEIPAAAVQSGDASAVEIGEHETAAISAAQAVTEVRKLIATLRDLPRLQSEVDAKLAVRDAAQTAYRQAERDEAAARRLIEDADHWLAETRTAVDAAAARLAQHEVGLRAIDAAGPLTGPRQYAEAVFHHEERLQDHQMAQAAQIAARQQHHVATERLEVAASRLGQAAAEVDAISANLPTVEDLTGRLRDARAVVQQHMPWQQQWTNAWRNNPWREGYVTRYSELRVDGAVVLKPEAWQTQKISPFGHLPVKGYGATKDWREVVIHNGLKGIIKGARSNTLVSSWQYAMGLRTADSIWKEAALGAGFGAVRGMVDGAGINRTYFQGSLEEIVWRAGTKGLDRMIRSELVPLIEQTPGSLAPVRPDPHRHASPPVADDPPHHTAPGKDIQAVLRGESPSRG